LIPQTAWLAGRSAEDASKRKVRLAMAAMGQPKTKVADLCRELGVTRQTLYRNVSEEGSLREDGRKLLKTKQPTAMGS
jgi:transposase-like protein